MSVPSEFGSRLGIRLFLTLVGHTVLTYDYLLTFDLEVDYIWCAPWTTVKVVFLLNRYGTLIGQSFITLEELGLLSHGSQEFCIIFVWFQSLFVLVSSESARTLLLLRARALWKCSYPVATSLVSIYVFYVLVLGGYSSYILFRYRSNFDFIYLTETLVCVIYTTTDVSIAWLLGLISFLLDTGMFAVIGYYLYKLSKGSLQLQQSPLLRLLMRDALIFYMMNIVHDGLTVITLSAFVNDPRNLVQVAFSFPLLIVTGQRVVLNLRGFQSKSYATPDISRSVDRQMAAMQGHPFLRSLDSWMSDLHQELELDEELSRRRTTGSAEPQVVEQDSHELDVYAC